MGYVQTDENRWEYQKVVDKLSSKEDVSIKEKKEEKKSFSLKLWNTRRPIEIIWKIIAIESSADIGFFFNLNRDPAVVGWRQRDL